MSRALIAGAALCLAALLAAATASLAQTSNQRIPGIDVFVQKKPSGGKLVVASVDANGAFGGSAKLPAGTYAVSTACSPRVRCPAHRLTSLMVNGRTVNTTASGGIHVAAGDINGDGTTDLTTFSGTITLKR